MEQPVIVQIVVRPIRIDGQDQTSLIGLGKDSKLYRWQRDNGGYWELDIYQQEPALASNTSKKGNWY